MLRKKAQLRVAGLLLMAVANPICRYITKKQREKFAPEILVLTDGLMKKNSF